jgi:hypothetical protein
MLLEPPAEIVQCPLTAFKKEACRDKKTGKEYGPGKDMSVDEKKAKKTPQLSHRPV